MVVFVLLFTFTTVLVALGCSKKAEKKKENKPIANSKPSQTKECASPSTPGVTTTPTTSNEAATPIDKPPAGSKETEPLKFDIKSNNSSEPVGTNLETVEDFDNPLNDKKVLAKLRRGTSATKSHDSTEKSPDQQEKSVNPTLPSTCDKKESTTIMMKNTTGYVPMSRYIN